MRSTHELVDYVVEFMADWASVTARRMFSGYSWYREGLMFVLVADGELFSKTTSGNIMQFESAGSRPSVYQVRNRTVQMSYWSAPASSLDSTTDMGN